MGKECSCPVGSACGYPARRHCTVMGAAEKNWESAVIPLFASPPRSASAAARSLKRRGGCVIKKISRSPEADAAGVVFLLYQSENHPGLAISGGFAAFY